MDDNDLDDEDRAVLAEVNKKGYYHGRPLSSATAPPPPQRIDGGAPQQENGGPQRIDAAQAAALLASSGRHSDHDAFQRRWDKFDDDDFVEKCVESASSNSARSGKASSRKSGASGKSSDQNQIIGEVLE